MRRCRSSPRRDYRPGGSTSLTSRPMLSSQPLLRALLAVDEDRTATMGRLFLVALVVLSPWWGRSLWRFVRDRRDLSRAARAADRAAAERSSPTDPDALSEVIRSIEAAAGDESELFDVSIPAAPTIERRPTDRSVVDAIVSDALRRWRVVVLDEGVDPEGRRTLRCRKVEQASR